MIMIPAILAKIQAVIPGKSLTIILVASAINLSSIMLFSQDSQASSKLEVSCDTEAEIPSVIATIFQGERTQKTTLLKFEPAYFTPETVVQHCQTAASTLESAYATGEMNYLASDTIEQKPVVCLVARRGVGCDSYNSQILFILERSVNPNQVLHDMLGDNFKQGELPNHRTVSRIYTDITPSWWPFD